MINKKKCTKCGDEKYLDDFYISKKARDLRTSCCKKCHNIRAKNYRHTKRGLISVIHYNQKQSSINRGHKAPLYTSADLLVFALSSPEFNFIYKAWVRSGYKKEMSPSFDRADDYKGYSFENFNKWMPWKDNNQKGRDDARDGVNNKNRRAVIGVSVSTGAVVTFRSIKEAKDGLELKSDHISRCCRNKYGFKSCGGYTWKYKNETK